MADAHVTLVSGLRLREGAETRHRALHEEGVRAARALGGLVGAQLVPAVAGAQDQTVALLTFDTRQHLDRWLDSPERSHLLARMQLLAIEDRSLTVLSGFPGWFGSAPAFPPRWKQAAVVVAGLIPVSLLVSELRELVLPDLPLVAVVVMQAIANVAALTWLVLPVLNRVFAGWLSS